jgi:hypothetical protein
MGKLDNMHCQEFSDAIDMLIDKRGSDLHPDDVVRVLKDAITQIHLETNAAQRTLLRHRNTHESGDLRCRTMSKYHGPSNAEHVGLNVLAIECLREAWAKYWCEAKKRLAPHEAGPTGEDIAEAQQVFLTAVYDDSLRRHVAIETIKESHPMVIKLALSDCASAIFLQEGIRAYLVKHPNAVKEIIALATEEPDAVPF